ncbi:MAG: hypothetical protein H0U35_01445, partial [Sporichthyaceae bacterium]|nr:hypothetical protein [Sporichthyaceae bacterium]
AAHYATTANLTSTVTSATTDIYAGWSGQFNLSHGPCGEPEDTPATAVRPSVTQARCTGDYTLTTPSFTVDNTVGVDYYVGATKVTGTVNAVAGTTVTVTAKAQDGYDLTGPATFDLVFSANPACEKPGDIQASAIAPSLTQAECTKDYSLTTPSFTVDATVGVDYYVGAVKVSGTVDAVAGTTVTVTAKAQGDYVLTGPTTFELVFTANPPCEKPGESHVPVNVCHATGAANLPYVFITVDDDSADFQGHLTHRNDPRPNTPADLIGDYTDADGVFHAYDGEITGLDDCGQPDTTVIAVRPTITQAECTAAYTLTTPSYTVPVTEGVVYRVGSTVVSGTVQAVAGTTVTVVAQATEGYQLEGPANFTLVFTANPACEKPVTPPKASAVSPVFVDSVCLPGILGSSRLASYTVASTVGVDYFLGDVKLAAGKVEVADGAAVTITAKAQSGFILEGVTTFTHTFPVPVCSTGSTGSTGTTGTSVTTPVEVVTEVMADSAVLGVKTGQTPAAASPASASAGTLPQTGAGLPIGISLTGSLLLLVSGGLILALSGRRSAQRQA